MPALERPSAIRASTSRSRAVSGSRPPGAPPGGKEVADHLGVERGAAGRDPGHGVGELVHVGDPVLEQVAHAGRAGAQQPGRIHGLDVLRQHQHRGARMGPAQLDRGPQPFIGPGGRHPDIGDDHVGVMLRDRRQQGGAVGDRGAHLVALVFQQPGQPGPEQGGVLGDHDAHRRMLSCVQRNLDGDTGRPAGRAGDRQAAVNDGGRLREPGQAAAAGRVRSAAAVVGDRQHQPSRPL